MTDMLHGHPAPHHESLGKGVEKGIGGVWKSVEKHWVWYAAGAGAIIVAYLILNAGSSSGSSLTNAGVTPSTSGSASTNDIGPNDAAVEIAQITANGQALQAKMQLAATKIAADSATTSASISADSQDYIQTVTSGNQSADTIGALLADQNTGVASALEQGFGQFMSSTASEVSSVAGAAASTAVSNNTASQGPAGNPINQILSGASLLMGRAGSLGILPSNAAATTGLSIMNLNSGGLSIGGLL